MKLMKSARLRASDGFGASPASQVVHEWDEAARTNAGVAFVF